MLLEDRTNRMVGVTLSAVVAEQLIHCLKDPNWNPSGQGYAPGGPTDQNQWDQNTGGPGGWDQASNTLSGQQGQPGGQWNQSGGVGAGGYGNADYQGNAPSGGNYGSGGDYGRSGAGTGVGGGNQWDQGDAGQWDQGNAGAGNTPSGQGYGGSGQGAGQPSLGQRLKGELFPHSL